MSNKASGKMEADVEQLAALIAAIRADMARIEGKLDALFALRQQGAAAPASKYGRAEAHKMLGSLTTKQHCIAQMMVLGVVDRVIGERMGVTRNTVKLQRSAIAKKVGADNARDAVRVVAGLLELVDPIEYQRLSAGLPKSWAATWSHPDPYAYLYQRQNLTAP